MNLISDYKNLVDLVYDYEFIELKKQVLSEESSQFLTQFSTFYLIPTFSKNLM